MDTQILNSREEMLKIDQSNVMGSVEALADQIKHAWEATQSITFSPTSEIRNVVVSGMGGSGLGADVIKNLYKLDLKVPFDFVHEYTLPGYVNENTLVVLASYSGTTEETLACADDAIARKAQVMVIAAGGKLIELATQHNWTHYKIEPTYNPSNQPRMAIGYAVFGTLALLSKAGIISLNQADVDTTYAAVKAQVEKCNPEVPLESNPAKQLAVELLGKRPIYVGAEFMEGSIHASVNQTNENAKAFADYKIVPEINHHLMEGLKFPETNKTSHLFVFLQSDLYQKRNQLRIELTPQVVEQNGLSARTVKLTAPTKLAQVFESLSLFGFVGLYLSMLTGTNPTPIPYVDWFKEQLSKM
jgi:glucose/mannose-6-phosphate isomerase